MIDPSTEEETLEILQNIKERYEDYHHVRYTDEALLACVQLTTRYITERQLPDKAIDAMDEVGAKAHLQHAVIPQEILDKGLRLWLRCLVFPFRRFQNLKKACFASFQTL